MAKCKLFDNWTWSITMPEPFDDSSTVSVRRTDVRSKYSPSSAACTIHPATVQAILTYMGLEHAAELGIPEQGAIGTQSENFLIAEYPSRTGKTHVVLFNSSTGKFTAMKMQDASGSPGNYSLKASCESGAALFFALMTRALEDEEFAEYYRQLWECHKAGYPDPEEAARYAAVCCDNLYRRIENPAGCGSSGIRLTIPASGNIQPFTTLNLNKGIYNPTSVIMGEFKIMEPGAAPAKKAAPVDPLRFVGKYQFSDEALSPWEQGMVPELPAWYAIPEQIVTACRHVKETTGSLQPMRNLMFRGPAGTGKTEGVKAFAAAVNRPYCCITCNANFEIYDLLGQMLPETGSAKDAGHDPSIPSLQDIRMDPPTAYYTLTGEYDEDIDENAVYDKLVEVLAQRAEGNASDGKMRFRYVDTPLVQAIRNGWVCELQEPTVISNPGVLVGLNSLLDRCNSITLPTGETIRRHPDCVIIITTNTGYEGCRPMNQSVLSRMNLIIDFDQPDVNTMATRVSGISGCPDKGAIARMVESVAEITERCRANMITDGSCGMRELIAWVQSYMIENDFLESAKYTVLSAVSEDPENREEILQSCLMPRFAP